MNLKKVTSLTLTAFLLLSFFTGCAGEDAGSSSAPEPSSSDTADTFVPSQNKREPERIDYDESTFPEVSVTAQHAEVVIERGDRTKPEQRLNDYFNFYENLSFASYTGYTSDPDYDGTTKMGVYNFDTKKFQQITTMNSYTASTGSNVIMEGRYHYIWWGGSELDENGKAVPYCSLYRTDAQDNTITIVETRDDVHFLSMGLSKLNEDTFIGISARWDGDMLAEGETKTTFLEKYDGKTGKREVIAQETFTCGETDRNSTGINIEQVTAIDGTIYAFGRRREDGVDKCYIYTYDENGNRLTETEYPELYAGFDANTRLFYVFGDYYIIKSMEGLTDSLFKMEDGKLKLVFAYTRGNYFGSGFAGGMDSLYDSSRINYLYYMRNSEPSTIFALNIHTDEITKLNIGIDDEYSKIAQFSVDENGNMLIDLYKGEEMQDDQVYYLTAETLDQLIKSAS